MMEIEILYSDLSRKRVPIKKADTLLRTGVLAIIISCEDKIRPRFNGYRRVTQGIGKDFYYLYNEDDMYALDSRDEGELIHFFNEDEPWEIHYTEQPEYVWSTIIFEGKQVSEKLWKEALKIFEKEMH